MRSSREERGSASALCANRTAVQGRQVVGREWPCTCCDQECFMGGLGCSNGRPGGGATKPGAAGGQPCCTRCSRLTPTLTQNATRAIRQALVECLVGSRGQQEDAPHIAPTHGRLLKACTCTSLQSAMHGHADALTWRPPLQADVHPLWCGRASACSPCSLPPAPLAWRHQR